LDFRGKGSAASFSSIYEAACSVVAIDRSAGTGTMDGTRSDVAGLPDFVLFGNVLRRNIAAPRRFII